MKKYKFVTKDGSFNVIDLRGNDDEESFSSSSSSSSSSKDLSDSGSNS